MLETYENALQLIVLLLCAGITMYKAIAYRSRTWSLAFFFYGCWVLGDSYWLFYIVFLGENPQISIVSDLSWYASLLFLYLLLRHISPPEKCNSIPPVSWLGPAFAVAMAAFFMLQGEIISNVIYAGLIGLLLFSAIRRITASHSIRCDCCLPILILIYCLLLYALWMASVFWDESVLLQPYYVFDFLLTVFFLSLLPVIKKTITA